MAGGGWGSAKPRCKAHLAQHSRGATDHTTLAWWHARWQAALSGLHPKCNKLLQVMHKTGVLECPANHVPMVV